MKTVSLVSGNMLAKVRTEKKPVNPLIKLRTGKTEIEQSLARSQSMLGAVEAIRTIFERQDGYIYIPDLRLAAQF